MSPYPPPPPRCARCGAPVAQQYTRPPRPVLVNVDPMAGTWWLVDPATPDQGELGRELVVLDREGAIARGRQVSPGDGRGVAVTGHPWHGSTCPTPRPRQSPATLPWGPQAP